LLSLLPEAVVMAATAEAAKALPTKSKKSYDDVEQRIKTLYPAEDEIESTDTE
jgi:hypothetical protein